MGQPKLLRNCDGISVTLSQAPSKPLDSGAPGLLCKIAFRRYRTGCKEYQSGSGGVHGRPQVQAGKECSSGIPSKKCIAGEHDRGAALMAGAQLT